MKMSSGASCRTELPNIPDSDMQLWISIAETLWVAAIESRYLMSKESWLPGTKTDEKPA